MPVAPSPDDIYDRAKEEGQRRLAMPPLMQASTGFIAGVTIVFGIVALSLGVGLSEPLLGASAAKVVGALAFGIGLVFLVVGRSELFTENFFDPVAQAVDQRRRSTFARLGRLWLLVLVFNLVGGAVMVAIFSVDGALVTEAHDSLVKVAGEITAKSSVATLARGVAAGTLLTLLSYLLNAVDSVGGRIAVAYMVGVFLALGPFDHVVVSALHLLFGLWLGGAVTHADIAVNFALALVGNLVGGLLLMTLTHVVQERGSRGRWRA